MNARILLSALALMVLLAVPAVADHHEGGDQAGGMGPMGPPEQIKELAYLEGDWDVAMKFRMGPDAPWMDSTAEAHVKSVLGGGAIHMTFEGEVMGMPMTGYQMYTYDREEKQYESIWIDNFACRTSHSAGQFEGGKLVMTGDDLHQGQQMHMRFTQTKTGKDGFDWTMEQSMDGENWFTGMEMTYKRQADGG